MNIHVDERHIAWNTFWYMEMMINWYLSVILNNSFRWMPSSDWISFKNYNFYTLFYVLIVFSLNFRLKMASSHLSWLIVRNHNAFLLKQRNIPKPFSTVSIRFLLFIIITRSNSVYDDYLYHQDLWNTVSWRYICYFWCFF